MLKEYSYYRLLSSIFLLLIINYELMFSVIIGDIASCFIEKDRIPLSRFKKYNVEQLEYVNFTVIFVVQLSQ